MSNVTAAQIDLAARGAAWGDAVGTALANNLGPLAGQAANFLEDAAQGSAVYSASLGSQPMHAPFQGSNVQVTIHVTDTAGQSATDTTTTTSVVGVLNYHQFS